jgi:hypothetical protein
MGRARAALVIRRQPKTSLNGGGSARGRMRASARLYGRRSVVKASFGRNRGNRSWVRHARYLARDRAQHEVGRGLGFDSSRDDLEMATMVRDWERSDQLMWSIIISPEDADRIDLRQHVCNLVAGMERDFGTRLE